MQGIVEINFLNLKEDVKLKKFAQEVVNVCFQKENLEDLNFYLSITLTTPEQIHKLNKNFRNVDSETDVLSFPMFEKNEIDKIVKERIRNMIPEVLGDIVISIERVKEQAEEYGHSFERELSYMIVHGFYHIMGYDHIDEDEKAVMRAKEEEVLGILNQTR